MAKASGGDQGARGNLGGGGFRASSTTRVTRTANAGNKRVVGKQTPTQNKKFSGSIANPTPASSGKKALQSDRTLSTKFNKSEKAKANSGNIPGFKPMKVANVKYAQKNYSFMKPAKSVSTVKPKAPVKPSSGKLNAKRGN